MVAAIVFWPAGLGLLRQGLQPLPWPQRLLALALGLMLVEQAHMARVDVRRVLTVWQTLETEPPIEAPSLTRFSAILALTLIGELGGFYLAAAGWLGLGMVTILLSLLGFNLSANGRFVGETFQPAGPRSRLDVLAMDLLALGLAMLWMLNWGRLGVASLLLGVTVIYGLAKVYAYLTGRASLAERPASAVHVPNAAQQHPQSTQQNR